MHHVGWESRTDVVLLFYFKRAFFFFTFLLLRCARILPSTVPASSPALFDLHLHLILLHFASPCSHFREFRFERFYFRFQVRLCFVWFEAVRHSFSSIFFFAFTDIVIVLSICLCFVVLVGFVWPIQVCLCCWFWHHHCGFGFGITTTLQEVCFYLL